MEPRSRASPLQGYFNEYFSPHNVLTPEINFKLRDFFGSALQQTRRRQPVVVDITRQNNYRTSILENFVPCCCRYPTQLGLQQLGFLQHIEDHTTHPKIGSYGARVGVRMQLKLGLYAMKSWFVHHILFESPRMARDFYATRPLVLWHILGTTLLLTWGWGLPK